MHMYIHTVHVYIHTVHVYIHTVHVYIHTVHVYVYTHVNSKLSYMLPYENKHTPGVHYFICLSISVLLCVYIASFDVCVCVCVQQIFSLQRVLQVGVL